nr:L-idonate 5-dehydrogenase-like [Ipomoea batatas]
MLCLDLRWCILQICATKLPDNVSLEKGAMCEPLSLGCPCIRAFWGSKILIADVDDRAYHSPKALAQTRPFKSHQAFRITQTGYVKCPQESDVYVLRLQDVDKEVEGKSPKNGWHLF